MHRLVLTDGTWFDGDAAMTWREDTYEDRGRRISVATGSDTHHEQVYRTRLGAWVLCEYGESPIERYRRISETEAAMWLIRNTEEPPDELHDAIDEREI